MIPSLVDISSEAPCISLFLIALADFPEWLANQPPSIQTWIALHQDEAVSGTFLVLPTESASAFAIFDPADMWSLGNLPTGLIPAIYQVASKITSDLADQLALVWGLGGYEFSRYKQGRKKIPQLVWPEQCDRVAVEALLNAIYSARDLINTPANDMGPEELARAAERLGLLYGASITQIVGDELLSHNFPLIHAVGRGSVKLPRLIDIRYGNTTHPCLTLVGKGVCFDTGGLDIKSHDCMMGMKKDMAGAAIMLALAELIIQTKLPVFLRVLIPAVENSVSGDAYHPGDVLASRKGISVEIGNTDAEGRLILADALTEAAADSPDLLIDIATLTGASRVALGIEINAFFTNQDALAEGLLTAANAVQEPMWRMPLYEPYRKLLDSNIAHINNASSIVYGGAITAALFLKEFLPPNINWIHLDVMAWNISARPGRPEGAEAMALRSIFAYLKQRYTS